MRRMWWGLLRSRDMLGRVQQAGATPGRQHDTKSLWPVPHCLW